MEKEYGKLTIEQFRQIISKLPEIRKQRHELADLVKSCSKERVAELLGEGFYWAPVYEMSFINHIAWFVAAMGQQEVIKTAAQAPDPQQVVLDTMVGDFEWNGGLFTKGNLIGLAVSVQRTILSILIYQRSLSGLVEEVRRGNDDSLFDAVRVDRTIMSCPTIADRLSRAEMSQDKHFFIRLGKAIKGLSRKHWESYGDLRYALYTLREMGFDKLSDQQLENLLVHQLKVYPNTYNAQRNLRKQFAQSKKISTT